MRARARLGRADRPRPQQPQDRRGGGGQEKCAPAVCSWGHATEEQAAEAADRLLEREGRARANAELLDKLRLLCACFDGAVVGVELGGRGGGEGGGNGGNGGGANSAGAAGAPTLTLSLPTRLLPAGVGEDEARALFPLERLLAATDEALADADAAEDENEAAAANAANNNAKTTTTARPFRPVGPRLIRPAAGAVDGMSGARPEAALALRRALVRRAGQTHRMGVSFFVGVQLNPQGGGWLSQKVCRSAASRGVPVSNTVRGGRHEDEWECARAMDAVLSAAGLAPPNAEVLEVARRIKESGYWESAVGARAEGGGGGGGAPADGCGGDPSLLPEGVEQAVADALMPLSMLRPGRMVVLDDGGGGGGWWGGW